ncbi:6256_t:CDS:2, partial [Scutellospora calospora]
YIIYCSDLDRHKPLFHALPTDGSTGFTTAPVFPSYSNFKVSTTWHLTIILQWRAKPELAFFTFVDQCALRSRILWLGSHFFLRSDHIDPITITSALIKYPDREFGS